MLTKKYPKFSTEDTVTVDDILEWDIWPAFMQIYGTCMACFCMHVYTFN